MAADGVVLVCYPNNQNDVESSRSVIEELWHYRLHPFKQAHTGRHKQVDTHKQEDTNKQEDTHKQV